MNVTSEGSGAVGRKRKTQRGGGRGILAIIGMIESHHGGKKAKGAGKAGKENPREKGKGIGETLQVRSRNPPFGEWGKLPNQGNMCSSFFGRWR